MQLTYISLFTGLVWYFWRTTRQLLTFGTIYIREKIVLSKRAVLRHSRYVTADVLHTFTTHSKMSMTSVLRTGSVVES